MGKIVQFIVDWSEVWALLIPLFFLIISGTKQSVLLTPFIIYLYIALALNLFGDLIGEYKRMYHFPAWLQSNNPIYNIHSVVRFICFSYFFLSLPQSQFKTVKRVILIVFLLFVIINFIFFENFFLPDHLSGNLLSAEAYLLLIYCMLYYLAALNDENDIIASGPGFWIVTGLSVYVVVSFFVFLFYVPMITQNPMLANHMWDIHDAAYVIFCVFITRAFYATT